MNELQELIAKINSFAEIDTSKKITESEQLDEYEINETDALRLAQKAFRLARALEIKIENLERELQNLKADSGNKVF